MTHPSSYRWWLNNAVLTESKHTHVNSPREAVLIVNTKSRRGRELFDKTRSILEADGINLLHAWEIDSPEQLMTRLQEATSQEFPLVIVGGGDGTLSGVTRYFLGSRSILGVLPLGTGNEFARDLGIRPDVEAACRVLTTGRVLEVDVGTVANGYFLNVATTGLTTLIAQGLRADEKRRFGRLAYVFALARALRKVRPFRVTLTMPEGVHTFETLQVVVGNGRYHAGPFPIGPNATLTDGNLTTYVVATTSRWGLLRYALHLPGGHQVDLNEVPLFTTTSVDLETTPSQRVTADGDVQYQTPISLGVAPKALRVMAPPESPVGTEQYVGPVLPRS